MGCALFSMLKTRTLSCMLVIWAVLLFPFVNGTELVMSHAERCSRNAFWYEPTRDCIPLGKQSLQTVPPSGVACPLQGDWYWSSKLSLCLPSSPVSGSVLCPIRYTWDTVANKCVLVQHCAVTEFWFPERATCLSRRSIGPPSALCPSGWYWNIALLGCAPANPDVLLSPTCGDGSVWSPSTLTCQGASRHSPPGTPSRRSLPSPSPGQHSRRKSLKSRAVSLCPSGLDACPILRMGDLRDYECVDPHYDLQHCGGCSTDRRGEDCTSIQGVWNVECISARCSVLTCRPGYIPSADQRGCIKL